MLMPTKVVSTISIYLIKSPEVMFKIFTNSGTFNLPLKQIAWNGYISQTVAYYAILIYPRVFQMPFLLLSPNHVLEKNTKLDNK